MQGIHVGGGSLKRKELPHSLEAEEGTLGSMIKSPQIAIPLCVEKISEDYFYVPANKATWTELVAMWGEGGAIDLITFTQRLRDKNVLEAIGGAAFVTHLFTFCPTADNIAHYLEIVRDKYILRQLIALGNEASQRATKEQGEVNALVDDIAIKVAAIGNDRFKVKRRTLKEHVEDKLERMQTGEPDADIIPTKILELDRLSPLRKGAMPVIKGKTKNGKSTLGLTIMENICISQGRPGLIFSLEERIPAIIDRIFAGISRIPSHRHHVKKMLPEEIDKAAHYAAKIGDSDIIIYDDIFDLIPMIAMAKKVLAEHPDLAVIMVDYLQLVRTVSKKSDTREREVADISRSWRLFAMETGVPVILISQENEQGSTRESRAVEQDCTALLKVSLDPISKEAKVFIEFQRSGPSQEGFVMRFLGDLCRMENPARKINENNH